MFLSSVDVASPFGALFSFPRSVEWFPPITFFFRALKVFKASVWQKAWMGMGQTTCLPIMLPTGTQFGETGEKTYINR